MRVTPTRQVLTGFEDITMIDLDTIDYSNLNRQFLFRAKHVGRSKAEVARESVLEFPHGEKLVIKAEHGNIKSSQFTLDFFKSFNIVLNGLDNVDARRHVNRVCLAAGVPLACSSYHAQEAELDARSLGARLGAKLLGGPQPNPFASELPHLDETFPGRSYAANSFLTLCVGYDKGGGSY